MLATLIKKYHFLRLQNATHDPKTLQNKILLDIVRSNRTSGFGREHNFDRICSLDDFRRHVPIRSSADYAPWLTRLYQGEHQLLTTERPHFFAMTAGSTGDYKYIPVTSRSKKEIDRSVYAFYHLLETNCPEFRTAPIQFFVGSAEGGKSPGGIPQGFISGFNYKNLPAFIRRKFVIPYWVFTLTDIDDRFYAVARFLAASRQVAGIGGFSPLAMISVAKAALSNTERLRNDIASGTLTLRNASAGVPKPEALSFEPDPVLAQQVSQWKSRNGSAPELMQILFPKIKYIACWMGGNMSHTLETLLQLTGPKTLHEMPFSASEGVFGIPYQTATEGGIAAITSHFLEYIREEDIDKPDARALGAWELQKDQYYYQIITTSAGLYRYNMEDLIRVSGFYNYAPVVQFVSKKARQISISNERINENDVTEAFRKTCEQTGIDISQFVLFPTHDYRYCLVVEQCDQELAMFAREFENQLRHHAKGYHVERSARSLQPVRLLETRRGELQDYVNAIYFRSALPSSQYKPIHLSSSFTDINKFSIAKMHENASEQQRTVHSV